MKGVYFLSLWKKEGSPGFSSGPHGLLLFIHDCGKCYPSCHKITAKAIPKYNISPSPGDQSMKLLIMHTIPGFLLPSVPVSSIPSQQKHTQGYKREFLNPVRMTEILLFFFFFPLTCMGKQQDGHQQESLPPP